MNAWAWMLGGVLGMVWTTGMATETKPAPMATSQAVWHLSMVGDVMLGSNYPTPRLPPSEGQGLLGEAAPMLQRAQVAMGNLEGTIAEGGQSRKSCAKCYSFRSPPWAARRLHEAGFDAWSTANNHAKDFGEAGLAQTQHFLKQHHMTSTGAWGQPEAQVMVQGKTVCLLAYAPNQGMKSLLNVAQMTQDVRSLRRTCHLIVVSFHGGAEGADRSHTPHGMETYLGESRGDLRRFARAAVEHGADVVFGHGPHVPRGMEVHRGHLIAYSLGNFMTYGGMSVQGVLGYAPLLEIQLNAQGQLVEGKVHSFLQTPFQPLRLDPQQRAMRLIQARSQSDFEGGGLRFEADGRFRPHP